MDVETGTPQQPATPIRARWAPLLRAPARAAAVSRTERHLILVRQLGWQSLEDWHGIAEHVSDYEPAICVFVVRGDLPHSYTRVKAARRPTFVFSPGRLVRFRPA